MGKAEKIKRNLEAKIKSKKEAEDAFLEDIKSMKDDSIYSVEEPSGKMALYGVMMHGKSWKKFYLD